MRIAFFETNGASSCERLSELYTVGGAMPISYTWARSAGPVPSRPIPGFHLLMACLSAGGAGAGAARGARWRHDAGAPGESPAAREVSSAFDRFRGGAAGSGA